MPTPSDNNDSIPSGVTEVTSVIARDGRLVVVVQVDGGPTFAIDRDEAVALAVTMLAASAKLFPSAEEFNDAVTTARGEIQNLLSPPPPQSIQ